MQVIYLGKKTPHNHQISQYVDTYLIKVKIKCLWKVVELDLDGFFLVSFSWEFTSEGNKLGSCLNLAASCGQKFMQHVTSYRGVWLSGSCDVQTNLGMLVAIQTWHFDIHRDTVPCQQSIFALGRCPVKDCQSHGLSTLLSLQYLYLFMTKFLQILKVTSLLKEKN